MPLDDSLMSSRDRAATEKGRDDAFARDRMTDKAAGAAMERLSSDSEEETKRHDQAENDLTERDHRIHRANRPNQ